MPFSTQSAILGKESVDTALGIAALVNQDNNARLCWCLTLDIPTWIIFCCIFLIPRTAKHIPPSTSNSSNASSLADNQIRIFCFILFRSKNSFSVKVEKDKTVEDLCSAIIDKAKLENDNFELFKPPNPFLL